MKNWSSSDELNDIPELWAQIPDRAGMINILTGAVMSLAEARATGRFGPQTRKLQETANALRSKAEAWDFCAPMLQRIIEAIRARGWLEREFVWTISESLQIVADALECGSVTPVGTGTAIEGDATK